MLNNFKIIFEQVIEKDPSVVEDYDPYRSWHGSQYGSRYPSSTIHSAR